MVSWENQHSHRIPNRVYPLLEIRSERFHLGEAVECVSREKQKVCFLLNRKLGDFRQDGQRVHLFLDGQVKIGAMEVRVHDCIFPCPKHLRQSLSASSRR